MAIMHAKLMKESNILYQWSELLCYIDQAYVCLENRLSHWKEAVESKDAIIFHNPLESKEESKLVYVGEQLHL